MDALGKLGSSTAAQEGGPEVLIARMIDHTLLKPDASAEQIARLCEEARDYHFASVCVNPAYVRQCADLLADVDDVAVCTVIGFPLGATTTPVKVYETLQAIADGATEVDMVANIGAIKSRNWPLVREDIARVATAAHAGGARCKVILETGFLTDEEKLRVCQICKAAGADFVKTSTGFGPGGATVEDIALMRQTVGPEMGVKASGGVRTYEDAQHMIAAGATRIGASAGVSIVKEALGAAASESETSDY
ncbi:MAG: deoxyribose-phosphate aldolase [Anaerolineae bacterium]|nr:deoxyribose-phosphate aldolase [Anaerolineae bacterium]